MIASQRKLNVYTDGSCLGNPGVGGWAFIVLEDSESQAVSGASADTTNQRMELTAALNALRSLENGVHVSLFTDSKYLCDGMRFWLANWKRLDWVRPKLGPPLNMDLWKELDSESQRMMVEWHWVKAHNGDKYNEIVNQAAQDEAREIKRTLQENV